MIRIRHPDFQTCEVHGDELTDAIGPNGTVVLRRGIVVTGRVVDREGHPVRGARVGTGSDWFGSDPPIVETDGDGRFRLGHLRPRETVITVQAKGHGPERIELDARAGSPRWSSSSAHRGRSRDVWSIATVDRFPAFR